MVILNINIDINIDKAILENTDVDKAILENINIDKDNLEYLTNSPMYEEGLGPQKIPFR